MCKLSPYVVPNVYNSMQSSFLSLAQPWSGRSPQGKQVGVMGPWKGALAWPWWGRSLPKGNQWACWDPRLGPNVVRLPVHLPPPTSPCQPYTCVAPLCPYTPASGSAVTLYRGQMWAASQSTYHCQCPLTPLTTHVDPLMPPTLPDDPHTPTSLPEGELWPCTGAHCREPPSSPATKMSPDTPCNPCQPPDAPTPPDPPHTPTSLARGGAGTLTGPSVGSLLVHLPP